MTQQHSTERAQASTPAGAASFSPATCASGVCCVVYTGGARFLVDAESAMIWRRRGLRVYILGKQAPPE